MKNIFLILLLLCLVQCNKSNNDYELLDGISAQGIDLSHHNSNIAWNKLNIDFIYLKATEGVTYQDPKYLEYRDSCINNKILVGAYHFFSCSTSGIEQFKNFKNTVGNKFDLIPVLDIERCTITKQKLQKEVNDWINACYDYYKVYPIIYTSDLFYIKNLNGNELIEKCLVWLGDIGTYSVITPHIMRQIEIKKISGTKYPVDYNHLYISINKIKI